MVPNWIRRKYRRLAMGENSPRLSKSCFLQGIPVLLASLFCFCFNTGISFSQTTPILDAVNAFGPVSCGGSSDSAFRVNYVGVKSVNGWETEGSFASTLR